ncbi:MAG: helicase, partial [Chitinophagaceae bacterium]
GKAGTGKTTFLKYIRESTLKQTVVAAPTGVAAINAGGVTLHSFFQLPFGPFVPTSQNSLTNHEQGIIDQHSLFRNIKFFSAKRRLLEELELLIIDEISMVRADMLDAVDLILRQFRKNLHQPFGGVQVLFIGDLFQLPPVMPEDQWQILKHYYESPFFFHSKVIKQDPPVYIELKKIYRQSDQHFIDILNRIRNNEMIEDDFNILNKLYKPSLISSEDDRYITLTTHNHKADLTNQSALDKLEDPSYSFAATITGEFNEKNFPTDQQLTLRKGAQVMFVKNELGELKRYFNGKLAVVTSLTDERIVVELSGSGMKMALEKETWRNIRYNYNAEKGEIEEEEVGT